MDKIIASRWFTNLTTEGVIGIIITKRYSEVKAYIGVGKGHDEQLDCFYIQDGGSKIDPIKAGLLVYDGVNIYEYQEWCDFVKTLPVKEVNNE